MSSANAVAAWIVADRHANPAKGSALDALLETLGIAIGPVTVQQARLPGRRITPGARADLQRARILVTAVPMPWLRQQTSRDCSRQQDIDMHVRLAHRLPICL
jgi:hypothetical protein